jgi:hypothetical protein
MANPKPPWLISTQHYDLARRLGPEAAQREFMRQCQDPKRGDLPAAGVVHRLLERSPAAVMIAASTTLPKLRSRCAHQAYTLGVDLWSMVDDDVETDEATLSRLITLAGTRTEPRISVLPYRQRGTAADRERVSVVLESTLVHIIDGVSCRRVALAGCGLMMVNRAALDELWNRYADELRWLDDDGEHKVALFHMLLDDGKWLNEDYSFCARARQAGVPIYAPVDGMSIHDGYPLNLAQVL